MLVAGISGVNTLNATGQLIPFVTGVVSLVVALRDLVLGLLRKVSREVRLVHAQPLTNLARNFHNGTNITSSITLTYSETMSLTLP